MMNGCKMDEQEAKRVAEEAIDSINKPAIASAINTALAVLSGAMSFEPLTGISLATTSAAKGYLDDRSQTIVNAAIAKIALDNQTDVETIKKKLGALLIEPTKPALIYLVAQITGVEIGASADQIKLSVILNSSTIEELSPFIENEWIILEPNGNFMSLGCGNSINGAIEDKKRPYGMGSGFFMTIKGASA